MVHCRKGSCNLAQLGSQYPGWKLRSNLTSITNMYAFLISALLLVSSAYSAEKADCFGAKEAGNSNCGQAGAKVFYFHKSTRTCQPFFYQGCDGNGNRFSSKSECESTCKNAQAAGDMTQSLCASGAYPAGATSGKDVSCSNCPHGYECQGEQCCPTKEFTCGLQYDAGRFGSSGKHTPRYFYSKAFKNCMLFTFYGRDGNPNNFATYNECKNFCM
uniref:BPTI/Kunitz inhibitor domain-containing protein n=1 Tax=Caenorhabditis japonica TaxID=281687 RepID=A0A8R1DP66_CAEJA